VLLSLSKPIAARGDMTWDGVAVGVHGKVQARAVGVGVSGFYVFVALCAKDERGWGLTYRGGGIGEEVEVVVKLLIDVPFCEAFMGPFDHVLGLSVFDVLMFGEDTSRVTVAGRPSPRGRGTSYRCPVGGQGERRYSGGLVYAGDIGLGVPRFRCVRSESKPGAP
jgi:hypothetical protein